MNFQQMKLLVSAPNKASWPDLDMPEIVLAGRSNVGKSSLINTLCNQKQMAYVGNTPGKTRLLNFFDVGNEMVLVDVPGYGYANASQKMLIQFGQMMEEYFSLRTQLKGVVVLLDVRHKPTEDDLSMIEFARWRHLPILIVITKVDKCGHHELQKNLVRIAEAISIPIQDLILFSSKTRKGRDILISKIEDLIKN